MALEATISLKNEGSSNAASYRVVDSRIHRYRDFSFTTPSSVVKTGAVEVTVIPPRNTDMTLYKWFKSGDRLQCEVTMKYDDQKNDIVHTVSLRDAVCYGIAENFDISSEERRTLTLKIAATAVEIRQPN